MHEDKLEPKIPVLIEIQPERIIEVGEREIQGKARFEEFVKKGLRAQLKTGSLLTGQLFVELDFHPEAPEWHFVSSGPYPELPTVPSPLEQITERLANIVDKLDKVPIEQIGNDLRDTVQGTNRLVNAPELQEAIKALNETLQQTQRLAQTLNADVAPKVSNTLEQTERTLAEVASLTSSDSALQHDLRRALGELAEAARALTALLDYLERHPDSLIYGKGQGK
jgi:paraquat-inducible protein B